MRRDDQRLSKQFSDSLDFFITSSAGNQASNDGFYIGNQFFKNGVAAYYFQNALKGQADTNRDNVLSCFELKRYFASHASPTADENEQDMEIDYKNNVEQLIILGSSYESMNTVSESVLGVKSNPPGTEIWVNGKFYTTTPATITIPPGEHTLILKKQNYVEYKRDIHIDKNENVELFGNLLKIRETGLYSLRDSNAT